MAEFKTVIAEWDRMCEFSIDCSTCPLLGKKKGEGCQSWVLTIKKVGQWGAHKYV